jgi:dephospho-CoA kinase
MMKIGLTGNIGSGKSIVSRIFSVLEIPVFNADAVSAEMLVRRDVKTAVVRIFGSGILTSSSEIDRRKLGKIVFSQSSSLRTLNGILHPMVMKEFGDWCLAQGNSRYVIMEAAIIFESGIRDVFDKIIHVSCPVETTVGRVMSRDGISREDILKRLQFQFTDQKKISLADFVIKNDGTELVIPQVLSIHQQILGIS